MNFHTRTPKTVQSTKNQRFFKTSDAEHPPSENHFRCYKKHVKKIKTAQNRPAPLNRNQQMGDRTPPPSCLDAPRRRAIVDRRQQQPSRSFQFLELLATHCCCHCIALLFSVVANGSTNDCSSMFKKDILKNEEPCWVTLHTSCKSILVLVHNCTVVNNSVSARERCNAAPHSRAGRNRSKILGVHENQIRRFQYRAVNKKKHHW